MNRLLALLSVILLAAAAATPAVADTTTTFYFTGDCIDCSNPQGVLVLQNYTYGDELSGSNLVSFTYTSSLANVSVDQSSVFSLWGSLESTTGADTFGIGFTEAGENYTFQTIPDGTWCYGTASTCELSQCVGDLCGGGAIGIDHGTAAEFSLTPFDSATTPEPSSLVLLGTGIFGAAATLRRRLTT